MSVLDAPTHSPWSSKLFHSRANRIEGSPLGSPIIELQKRGDSRAWKGASIRRVNAINESARITWRGDAISPRSIRLVFPRPISSLSCTIVSTLLVLPCAYSRLVKLVERGHKFAGRADRWRGPRYPKCRRIQCFRALNGNKRFHPCPWRRVSSRRNQFCAQIPYLRARRNRRFELIVDEPSLARARALSLPPRTSSYFFSPIHSLASASLEDRHLGYA